MGINEKIEENFILKENESFKENLQLLCCVPPVLVRKCADHQFFQMIFPEKTCCILSKVSVPRWCCTDLVRGPGLL